MRYQLARYLSYYVRDTTQPSGLAQEYDFETFKRSHAL